MAVLLCVGALLWFKIDASKELSAESIVTHTGARWMIDIREPYHRLPATGPKAGGGRRWWVEDS
jgi:hypothetical protein